MKVYLNDEKTPVDPQPLYVILWGLKAVCGIFEQKPKPWLILVQQAKQSKYMYFLHHARAADQKAPYVPSSLKSGNHGYQIKMFSYAAQHLSTLGLHNKTSKCF